MIRLIKNVFIFSLPFLAVAVSIYLIDPYNYFHNVKQNDLKRDIAFLPDYGRRLYLITYKNDPQPNVLLGYSQADKIHLSHIPEPGWCKLTFGGADAWEVIESFKFTRSYNVAKKVMIDINAFNYMQACSRIPSNGSSLTYKAIQLIKNPHKYFYDKEVFRSSFNYLNSILLNDSSYKNAGKPKFSREMFWEYQLEKARKMFHSNPEISRKELKSSLQEIKNYCDRHDIDLIIFSSLMHTDLQKIAKEFKLKIFLPDMTEIFGEIRDFAYLNDYTRNDENFDDPFHATSDSLYINTLWNNDNRFSRIISKNNISEITN